MRYRSFVAAILVIGALAWTSRANAIFTTVDAPGAANGTSASGINDRGQIVGSYSDAAGKNHSFLLDDGTFTTIDFPGAVCTQAIGINDRGQIVGGYAEKSCNPFAGMVPHGFLLGDGTFTTIDVTRARGINNRGQIVGEAGANCFLLDGGTFTTIAVPGANFTFCSGINDRGQIVGGYFDSTGNHGFLLDDGTFTTIDVPGGTLTTPSGINDRGQIVGVYFASDSTGYHGHGFLLDDGTFTTIDVPGSPYTNAQGINNRGQIVGSYFDSTTGSLGFLLDLGLPSTAATLSLAPNSNGWNKANVVVNLNATDSMVGIKQITIVQSGAQSGSALVPGHSASLTITVEGTTTLSYFATDIAGSTETAKTLVVRLDKTAPTATALASPGPNASGWNNTNVTVSFTGTDTGSGIDFCTGPITLLGEGAGQSASGTCTDKAGNVSAPATATVNIDNTPPLVSGMPAASCNLWPPDQRMVTVATVTAADALSGLAPGSLNVTGTSSEPASDPNSPDIAITPNGAGGFTVQLRADRLGRGNGRVYALNATATDLAGNTATVTATCTVPHDQGK